MKVGPQLTPKRLNSNIRLTGCRKIAQNNSRQKHIQKKKNIHHKEYVINKRNSSEQKNSV
jgi:hypothetical protein